VVSATRARARERRRRCSAATAAAAFAISRIQYESGRKIFSASFSSIFDLCICIIAYSTSVAACGNFLLYFSGFFGSANEAVEEEETEQQQQQLGFYCRVFCEAIGFCL